MGCGIFGKITLTYAMRITCSGASLSRTAHVGDWGRKFSQHGCTQPLETDLQERDRATCKREPGGSTYWSGETGPDMVRWVYRLCGCFRRNQEATERLMCFGEPTSLIHNPVYPAPTRLDIKLHDRG